MVLFLIAAGLSIIFGTLKVLNLATAPFNMVGGFLCYGLTTTLATILDPFGGALLHGIRPQGHQYGARRRAHQKDPGIVASVVVKP